MSQQRSGEEGQPSVGCHQLGLAKGTSDLRSTCEPPGSLALRTDRPAYLLSGRLGLTMTTKPLDASGEARTALQSIAKDYGAAALSNPEFMNSLLRDMIPDSPKEASVLVAAADANVAGILQERAAQ